MINRLSPFLALMLAIGYVFLYGPIASLVLYSFNASRLVTVWAGFSTHWYVELMHNEAIRGAALISLEVAVSAASGGLVLGTLSGFALQRYRRFRLPNCTRTDPLSVNLMPLLARLIRICLKARRSV